MLILTEDVPQYSRRTLPDHLVALLHFWFSDEDFHMRHKFQEAGRHEWLFRGNCHLRYNAERERELSP